MYCTTKIKKTIFITMKPAEVYLLNQPEPFQSILLHLQLLIEKEFPGIELKYKWKTPVYYIDGKHLCYMNASIKKGYVDLGLWVSDTLKGYDKYLVSEGRKVVKSLRYYSLEDINVAILLEILNEVYSIKGKEFYKNS